MAFTGHSGMHTAQSMHSSGSITRKFGPSRKQSTGQTSTQSVYLQRMQASVTAWVMIGFGWGERFGGFAGGSRTAKPAILGLRPVVDSGRGYGERAGAHHRDGRAPGVQQAG